MTRKEAKQSLAFSTCGQGRNRTADTRIFSPLLLRKILDFESHAAVPAITCPYAKAPSSLLSKDQVNKLPLLLLSEPLGAKEEEIAEYAERHVHQEPERGEIDVELIPVRPH